MAEPYSFFDTHFFSTGECVDSSTSYHSCGKDSGTEVVGKADPSCATISTVNYDASTYKQTGYILIVSKYVIRVIIINRDFKTSG